MTVTEPHKLRELVDLIHDFWFDVEKIALDTTKKSAIFRVEPKHSDLVQGSAAGIIVMVKNVEKLMIHDMERVRDYDINQITFDPAKCALVITGGIPIEITFIVNALEVHACPVREENDAVSFRL
jgi:hypothetical protein